MPVSCGLDNGSRRTVIYTDHPLFAGVLASVMAAKLADREVTIEYLNTCNTRYGAWDFGYLSIR